jgi:diguanylate cyclase (GGDEF)-like protein
MTLLILGVLGIACIALIYVYIKRKNLCEQLEQQIVNDQTEIINLKEAEENLRQELNSLQDKFTHTMEDPLTSLLSWQLFEDRLNQNIREGARYKLTIGLLIIDIDDFNVINTALTNQIGDELLRIVAKRIQTSIRQVDSASRFAKDTFYVLLTQLSKAETAAIVAQRILQALQPSILINDQELFITACIGIAIYPTDGQDTTSLMRSADYALHLAKEKGKQIYQFYHEKIQTNSQRELALSTGLRRDTVLEELTIYYQPIVNVENNQIVCIDTLLHWQHPQLGLIDSQELFSYAEKQGTLNTISVWLLRNACKQFLAWRKSGFSPALLGIHLSFKQLENSQFIYQISQILQELEFNPEWILFEMKESPLQVSFDTIEKAINMLKYINVKIAIEDFGITPFSLRDLKKFTVNYLKLHRSFADDLADNPKSVNLIKAMVFLAKSLSIHLVIKGVETEQQLTILKKLDCKLMQGHFLGRAKSEKEIATNPQSLLPS